MKKIIFLFLTGLLFIQNVYSADPKAKRVRFTPAGTIEATNVQDAIEEVANEAGGGAPVAATYITQTVNGTLSAEQALTSLSDGLLKVNGTTGVLSNAVADTDYDSSTTNEINIITCPDANVTAGLGITFADEGSIAITETADTVTFTVTETDPNALLTAGTDNVKDTHIDWGVGANQVSAIDIPIADTDTQYTATEIESALAEIGMTGQIANGMTEKSVQCVITSDDTDITASLDSVAGTTITFKFSTGTTDVDVSTPMTAVLTAGTDTVPQLNYLYVLASDPTTLVKSTTSFPTAEYCHVGKIFVQSAPTVNTYGPLKQHTHSEELSNGNDTGHLGHVNGWIRNQWAEYRSEIAPTIAGTGTGTITWASTSGIVRRLHKQTFPAFTTGADVYAINDPDTTYRLVTNIADLQKSSTGVSLTNKYYGLVFWGAINDNGESKIFVNLPSGCETTAAKARTDAQKYINYGISSDFKGVGFLIHRLIIQNTADTTWTIYTGTGDDLRGYLPNVIAGTTTAIGTSFPDTTFEVFDDGDATKKAVFELSGMTTGKTLTLDSNITDNRTQAFQDLSGTFALLENKLSVFAATTSAELAGVISNETGSGAGALAVFNISPQFETSILGNYLTASKILITDASKNIVSAPVATYPSLTELSYVKGLSSAVQTQINDITGAEHPKSFVIHGPDADADAAVWRSDEAITIVGVHGVIEGGTNLVGHLAECDANGANCVAVDDTDITILTTNVNDDGTLSNPSIDAGDYVGWITTSVSGTITRAIISFEYTIN